MFREGLECRRAFVQPHSRRNSRGSPICKLLGEGCGETFAGLFTDFILLYMVQLCRRTRYLLLANLFRVSAQADYWELYVWGHSSDRHSGAAGKCSLVATSLRFICPPLMSLIARFLQRDRLSCESWTSNSSSLCNCLTSFHTEAKILESPS